MAIMCIHKLLWIFMSILCISQCLRETGYLLCDCAADKFQFNQFYLLFFFFVSGHVRVQMRQRQTAALRSPQIRHRGNWSFLQRRFNHGRQHSSSVQSEFCQQRKSCSRFRGA